MLNYAEHAVHRLIAQGAPLDQVEEHIDELPLDSEQRSALWLLAWVAVTNPATRRRLAPRHARSARPSAPPRARR